MSVQTKKRFKNLGRLISIGLFALLMLTNIKLSILDDQEISSGDFSLDSIELTLFEATYACCAPYCEVAFWDCKSTCEDYWSWGPPYNLACIYGCSIGYNDCCS